MAEQNVFDAAKHSANLYAIGGNKDSGGGAAAGGAKALGGPSDIYHNNELVQSHLVQTALAALAAVTRAPDFDKTQNLGSGLSVDDGFGIFKKDNDGWLDKLGSKGGALPNLFAKHITRDWDQHKFDIPQIFSMGGCQVDTSFHADNGSLVGAAPITPGFDGGHGRGGGHGEGIA